MIEAVNQSPPSLVVSCEELRDMHSTLGSDSKEDRASAWRLLLTYTASFVAIVPVVFWVFWRRGLALIDWGDGWAQHAKGLAYYGVWLRELLRGWLHGNFTVPTFALSFGYGSDLLSTLQYYTIGDPLNLLAVFCKPEYTEQLYGFLVIARFYLAGLAFAFAVRFVRKTGVGGLVVAALAYSFCSWMVVRATMHPFFADPLICFPLVILGVEMVIREGKTRMLLVAVAASAMVNFYFFYMIALITACYTAARLINLGIASSWKESGRQLVRIVIASFVGTALAAIALAPVAVAFLQSSRTAMPADIPWFYPNDYYKQLFLQFSANAPNPGKYAYVYVGPLGLVALLWLFTKFDFHWFERILVVAAGVFFVFPAFGHVFNGMGYPTNRWSWAYAFLACYLICILWDEFWDAPVSQVRNLAFLASVYMAIAAFLLHRTNWPRMEFEVVAGMLLIAVSLGVMMYARVSGGIHNAKVMLGVLASSAIALTSFWQFGNANWFVSQGVWRQAIGNNDASKVAEAARTYGDDFVRFARRIAPVDADNNSILSGVSSTEFYWSIDRTNAFGFYDALAINDGISYKRQGVDGRTIASTLVGAQYHVADSLENVPYGYTVVGQFGDTRMNSEYSVMRTEYALPLGYTYSRTIAPDRWNALSPSQREESLLHSVLLNEAEPTDRLLSDAPVSLTARSIPVTIAAGENVESTENSIETSGEGQTVHLAFDTKNSGEAHIRFAGIEAEVLSGDPADVDVNISFECATHIATNRMRYLTKEYQWFEGRHDYLVNSGYCEGPIAGATLSFSKEARISFDSLEVWSQPLEGFEDNVAELSAEKLENVDFHDIGLSRATNEITGDITVSEPKVLVMTLPKTDGWTAYVDGKKQDILTANLMWMGLELEPGHHDIQLVYRTPGLYEGAAVSCVTLLGLCVYAIIRRRRSRKMNSRQTLFELQSDVEEVVA